MTTTEAMILRVEVVYTPTPVMWGKKGQKEKIVLYNKAIFRVTFNRKHPRRSGHVHETASGKTFTKKYPGLKVEICKRVNLMRRKADLPPII